MSSISPRQRHKHTTLWVGGGGSLNEETNKDSILPFRTLLTVIVVLQCVSYITVVHVKRKFPLKINIPQELCWTVKPNREG